MSDIESYIKRLLPFSPEEIYRLKQYASDTIYHLYVTNRKTIEETIIRSKEAYNNAIRSLNMSREAMRYAELLENKLTHLSTTVSNLQQRVSVLSTQTIEISKKIIELNNMTDALKKAQLTLKKEINEARSNIREISKTLISLQNALANAWDQLEAIRKHLVNIGLDAWNEIIGQKILTYAKKVDTVRQQIISVWTNTKDAIEQINKKVLDALKIIGSPEEEGTILYEFKKRVLEYIDKIGTAEVDYSKIDGKSGYEERGNKGKGIIKELAKLGWDMGNFVWNLNNLIEHKKFEWTVPVVNYQIGFDIYVPRPDHLAMAVKWLFETIYDPINKLVSDFQDLQGRAGKLFEPLQWLVAKLSELQAYNMEYLRVFHIAVLETMNSILYLFSLEGKEVLIPEHEIAQPQHVLPYSLPNIEKAKSTTGEIPQLTIKEGEKLLTEIDLNGRIIEIKKQLGSKELKKIKIQKEAILPK